MKVILNGMGCPFSGSRIVLTELIHSVPHGIELLVVAPRVTGLPDFEGGENVRIVHFNHAYWGKYLRPILEITLNIFFIVSKSDLLINISNYGICFTKNQLLYIHNPYILSLDGEYGFGDGKPNFLTRWALNTFLKHGSAIFVQTDHMNEQLKTCPALRRIYSFRRTYEFRPLPNTTTATGAARTEALKKRFDFQLFYPASNFPHKRIDLAIESIRRVHTSNSRVGLIITATGQDRESDGVICIGNTGHDEVINYLCSSDALLFTSERETLGLPLLEALQYGKPAVLPAKEYAREIYGESAAYFEEFTISSISDAVSTLTRNYDFYCENAARRRDFEFQRRVSWEQHWDIFLGFVR